MSDPYVFFDETKNPIILKYLEKAKKYWQKINPLVINDCPRDVWSRTQLRKDVIYKEIIDDTKTSLLQFSYSETQIVDILVKYLYSKKSKYKDLLWTCYGDLILKNLEKRKKRTTKDIKCVDCGKWIEIDKYSGKQKRCKKCQSEYIKLYDRMRKNH